MNSKIIKWFNICSHCLGLWGTHNWATHLMSEIEFQIRNLKANQEQH